MSEAMPTNEAVRRYRDEGYVIARGLFTADEARACKAALADALAAERSSEATGVRVWMADAFRGDPPPLGPALRDAVADPRVLAWLGRLIGPKIEFLSAKVVFKSAATRFASPWHQDRPYWGGVEKLSIWVALDPARANNGCLKVIPESHRRDFGHRQIDGDRGFVNRIDEPELADLPVVTAEMDPGDALFFSDLAVHSSHPNTSGRDRWCLIPTYRDATVADASTVWSTSWPLEAGGT